jgi:hypothetical protein
MWEAIVPPGGGTPPHMHSREEEGFYILEGEIKFMIGEQRLVATAGMFANMPVGTPNSFRNESSKPAKMLISVAPAGLEGMFFYVGVPLPEGSTTAFDPETVINLWKAIAECDDSTRGGKCGIVLYSTAEPCFMCSYVIRQAEIPCLATCWMWITGTPRGLAFSRTRSIF